MKTKTLLARLVLRAAGFGGAVLSFDYLLRLWLNSHHLVWRFSLEFAGVAALSFFLDWQTQRRINERHKLIGYLNHHVRNAVTVIGGIEYIADPEKRREMLADSTRRLLDCVASIERIRWR